MRLYVGVFHAEKLLRTLYCKLLRNVYVLATAVIAFAGITFRILVGVESSCRRQNCFGNDVFACDEFEIVLLTFKFFEHRLVQFAVRFFYTFKVYHS